MGWLEYSTANAEPSRRQNTSVSTRQGKPWRNALKMGQSLSAEGLPSGWLWWVSACMLRPITSSAAKPSICAPARLMNTQLPARSMPNTPSPVDSSSSPKRFCQRALAPAGRFRTWVDIGVPKQWPCPGGDQEHIGDCAPARQHRTISGCKPLTRPLWPVFMRNLLVWRKLAIPSLVGNIAEPLMWLVAFGYGMGALVGQVNVGGTAGDTKVPYILFLASGSICMSAMNAASFEALYSAFSRMHVQKTWDGIMNAPVSLDDVV